MKRQRNTTQMKEQTRNTEVQINDKEIGQITWKRTQSDSRDYKKPWKQNGENVTRINQQRPRRIKE